MNLPDPTGLQPPLRTPEFEALYEVFKEGTVYQDMQRLLVYRVDTVHPSVLVHWLNSLMCLVIRGCCLRILNRSNGI